MYFPGFYGQSLSQIIAAMRMGQRGRAKDGLGYVSDYFDRIIQCIGGRSDIDLHAIQAFSVVVRDLSAAQVRSDWVRVADILEYELPHVGIEGLLDLAEVSLTVSPPRQRVGGQVAVEVHVAPHPERYEYQFIVQSQADIIPGSSRYWSAWTTDPRWVWEGIGEPGHYRITVHVRPIGTELNYLTAERYEIEIVESSPDAEREP